MKKSVLFLATLLLFLLPLGVEAASYKDMISYMKKAIQDRSNWTVGELKSGSYTYVNVKMGKLEGDLKKAWDNSKNVKFILFACSTSSKGKCTEDDSNHKSIGSISWIVKKKDNQLILESSFVPKAVYEAAKVNGSVFRYQAVSQHNVFWGTKEKEDGTITINTGNADESKVDDKLGTEGNPRIIRNSGSITVPAKDDKFWKGLDQKCIYFKFDWTDATKTGTYARYEIKPADLVETSVFWSNDARHTLAVNPLQDTEDANYFGIDEKNDYAICVDVTKIYGEKFTFTYKDTEILHVADQNSTEGRVQVGEENVVSPNNPTPTRSFDVMPSVSIDPNVSSALDGLDNSCEIIQTGTSTFQFLKKVINYIRIGTVFLVLVLGMVDMAGAVGSDEEGAFKKAGSRFGKRLIAAALVFLVPALVEILIALVNDAACPDSNHLENLFN